MILLKRRMILLERLMILLKRHSQLCFEAF